jgi:hypothetical protein
MCFAIPYTTAALIVAAFKSHGAAVPANLADKAFVHLPQPQPQVN